MCWHSDYATGWKILASISDRREILTILKNKETSQGPFNSLLNAYSELFSWELKRPWSKAEQSLSSSAEVNNVWIYISTPAIRLHGAERDKFTSYNKITA